MIIASDATRRRTCFISATATVSMAAALVSASWQTKLAALYSMVRVSSVARSAAAWMAVGSPFALLQITMASVPAMHIYRPRLSTQKPGVAGVARYGNLMATSRSIETSLLDGEEVVSN
jgi:hypothetical protein